MAYEKDPNEIGALWAKRSQAGNEFLSGNIDGIEVVCFKAKPSDRGPAWRVLKSTPRDARPASGAAPRAPERATPVREPGEDEDDGDF